MKSEILLCSECFRDEGLKINSYHIGMANENSCPNCNSTSGKKLDKTLIDKLMYQFFVVGTFYRTDFGGAPIIECNSYHNKKTDIKISKWLENDLELLENNGTMGLFYYGPRLWMVGEIEPLKALIDKSKRNEIITDILEKYPSRTLDSSNYFYRVRIDPKSPQSIQEYCAAPDELLGNGRLDSKSFPVLYGSEIIDLCLHECRVRSEDAIFMAKLRPTSKFKLLDLTALIDENVTEFESLDLAVHFLFLAGDHSYEICRDICKKAKSEGFDGIIFPSYFSYIASGHQPFDTTYGISIRKIPEMKDYAKSQSIPNIAIFGRPIRNKKITVESVNKVNLTKVTYNAIFGPVEV
ncbi:RES family NAD+ phosphorylase [Salegentibacter agarivorans]